MEMVEVSLGTYIFYSLAKRFIHILVGWIKRLFPEFEFTWLAGEMRENLPKEMDFQHEAHNSQRAEEDFKNVRTSLYIRGFICLLYGRCTRF